MATITLIKDEVAFCFGTALDHLKSGHAVTRAAWEAQGEWLEILNFQRLTDSTGQMDHEDAQTIVIRWGQAPNSLREWAPKTDDLLAEDWRCV